MMEKLNLLTTACCGCLEGFHLLSFDHYIIVQKYNLHYLV